MSHGEISRRTPKGGGGHGSHGSSGSSSSSSSSSTSSNKSGSSSSSYRYGSHGAGTTSGTTAAGGGGGGGGQSILPWWAILIIVLGTIFIVLFLCALGYYCLKERKRKSKGKKFRPGYAVWKAFRIASGLWLPIWLVKKLKGRKNAKSAGSYSKIEEGHSTNNNNNNHSNSGSWYGASAAASVEATPYSHGGSGSTTRADGARYEPMGYSSANTAAPALTPGDAANPSRYSQPVITGPIEQTDAIPLPTPSASPAPSMVSMVSAMTVPPPYPGGPPLSGAAVYKPPLEQLTYVQTPPPVASQYGETSGGSSSAHHPESQPIYAAPGSYR